MKKTFKLNIIELIGILFLTAFAVLLLTKVPDFISNINPLNKETINSYLGVIGNVLGGVIGGIVAYLVAAHQVSNSREQMLQQGLKNTYAIMLLLLDELEYNLKVLENVLDADVDEISKAQHLKKQITTRQWEDVNPIFAQHIEISSFKDTCDLYRNLQFAISTHETVDENFILTVKSKTEVVVEIFKNEMDGILGKIEQ